MDHNNHRISSAELRAKEGLFESDYKKLRRAAEVHRQTRKYAQSFIRPGMKIMDITNIVRECWKSCVYDRVSRYVPHDNRRETIDT